MKKRQLSAFIKKTFGILVLAGIGAGIAAFVLAPKDRTTVAPKTVRALPVDTFVARRSTGYEVKRAFAGRIVAGRTSRMGFERGGLLSRVTVDDGDQVKTGQVVARLDTAQLETRRRELAAEKNEAEARLTQAKLIEKRQADLLKRGHAAQQTYDNAKYEVAALAARLARIEAATASLDVDIAKSVLRAPFAGRVAERKVDEGTVVSAGQPVLEIYETGRQEARIGIPADMAAAMVPGRRFELDVGTKPRAAAVLSVSPTVDPATRTVNAILRLDPGPFLPAGKIVRLSLPRRFDQAGFWVPTTALSEGTRGLWSLYTIVDGKVARHAVEVLHVESRRVYVRGTLKDGDIVIRSGTHRLVPGQPVRLLPTAEQTAATD